MAWMALTYGGVNFWLTELLVFLLESVAIKQLANVSFRAALLLSLVLNGVSMLSGLLLFTN